MRNKTTVQQFQIAFKMYMITVTPQCRNSGISNKGSAGKIDLIDSAFTYCSLFCNSFKITVVNRNSVTFYSNIKLICIIGIPKTDQAILNAKYRSNQNSDYLSHASFSSKRLSAVCLTQPWLFTGAIIWEYCSTDED